MSQKEGCLRLCPNRLWKNVIYQVASMVLEKIVESLFSPFIFFHFDCHDGAFRFSAYCCSSLDHHDRGCVKSICKALQRVTQLGVQSENEITQG